MLQVKIASPDHECSKFIVSIYIISITMNPAVYPEVLMAAIVDHVVFSSKDTKGSSIKTFGGGGEWIFFDPPHSIQHISIQYIQFISGNVDHPPPHSTSYGTNIHT